MKRKKPKKQSFHVACVKWVKAASGGQLHPSRTTWEALAHAFEELSGSEPMEISNFKLRCYELAPLVGLMNYPAPRPYTGIPHTRKRDFYKSLDWKKLRYATLTRYDGKCMCCGSRENLRCDHIRPISRYWELRLDPENVQVLCNNCNWGKSNLDYTDWRQY